jgi:TetR/AcrR family transcriptional regulator
MAGRGRPKAMEQARQARSELYKKLIVDAAEAEFAEQGFEAARIQKVAERAALSVGTIYGLFASKIELYNAVHLVRGGALIERVGASMAEPDDALLAIERGIAHYVQFHAEHPAYLRMLLHEGTSWALSQDFSQPLLSNWRAGLSMVAAVIERGIAQDAFVERDAMRMAKTLTAMYQVQLADWVEHGLSEPPEALVTRLCQMFRRLYCR